MLTESRGRGLLLAATPLLLLACAQQPVVCTALYAYGLTVTVVDAPTGDSLRVAPAGVARDGSWSETMQVFGNHLLGAGERAGTYAISVTAPGYRAWDTTGVKVTADECHVRGVNLTARLAPEP